jgi:hypothetical protein
MQKRAGSDPLRFFVILSRGSPGRLVVPKAVAA